MKAAIVRSFDAPPVYDNFADPVAGEDEVMVSVSAAGLHPIVKALANGSHYGATTRPPFIPGVDGVGHLDDDTRVFFGTSHSPFGSFAQRTVTARAFCLRVPESLDDVTAAALMNPGMSSWGALKARAQFASGESVLILGATGVAGQLAVQVSKRLGAGRIVAAGRNSQALESLRDLGADEVVPLSQSKENLVAAFREALNKSEIDVVLDYLWGEPAETLMQAITQQGLHHAARRIRYLQIGSSAGPAISLSGATLRSSGLELLGSGFGSVSLQQILQAAADFLNEAATHPLQLKTSSAPLADVESLWNGVEPGARLVFQP